MPSDGSRHCQYTTALACQSFDAENDLSTYGGNDTDVGISLVVEKQGLHTHYALLAHSLARLKSTVNIFVSGGTDSCGTSLIASKITAFVRYLSSGTA